MGKLPEIFSLEKYNPVENIVVVGCGGNGGHLVPHLCRYIYVTNQARKEDDKIELFLVDGDVVEQKNLERQHFVAQDIAKNKASVLAERYASAFGIKINVITKYLESFEDFEFFSSSRKRIDRSDLIIGCVDNVKSRQLINKWFLNSPHDNGFHWRGKFWIDSGNEENSGQIICAYAPPSRGSFEAKKVDIHNNSIMSGEFSLPSVIEIYPELLKEESKFNSELSCAERAETAPQSMQTNVTAATLIMNYAQKVINGAPLKSHGIEFSINNVFSTKLNITKNLEKVNENRKRYWEKLGQ